MRLTNRPKRDKGVASSSTSATGMAEMALVGNTQASMPSMAASMSLRAASRARSRRRYSPAAVSRPSRMRRRMLASNLRSERSNSAPRWSYPSALISWPAMRMESAQRWGSAFSTSCMPRPLSVARASSYAANTAASTPSLSCSGKTQSRAPRGIAFTPSRTRRTGDWCDTGSSGSAPAITSSKMAPSRTLRARGPTVSWVGHSSIRPCRLISPCVVFSPTRPHSPAGMRTEPPVSVPMAAQARPAATATADPLLDPPGIRCVCMSQGFQGVPMTSFVPHPPKAYSTVWVLPITMAPAHRKRSTTVAVVVDIRAGKATEPPVMGLPWMSNRSFTATVTPCKGPRRMPARRRRSMACAVSRASSA